jgi:hypothetical protein
VLKGIADWHRAHRVGCLFGCEGKKLPCKGEISHTDHSEETREIESNPSNNGAGEHCARSCACVGKKSYVSQPSLHKKTDGVLGPHSGKREKRQEHAAVNIGTTL